VSDVPVLTLLFVVAAIALWLLSRLHRRRKQLLIQGAERQRREAGAEGERRLVEELLPLTGRGYLLFRGVAHRYFGDIDCLLVGPAGVVLAEAKAHRGEISYDAAAGQVLRDGEPLERDVYAQMRKQVEHVRGAVFGGEGPVKALVCFTRGRLDPGAPPPGACTPADVVSVILSSPRMLSGEEAEEVARRIEKAYGVAPLRTVERPPGPPASGERSRRGGEGPRYDHRR
jgi:hypothetical protein